MLYVDHFERFSMFKAFAVKKHAMIFQAFPLAYALSNIPH